LTRFAFANELEKNKKAQLFNNMCKLNRKCIVFLILEYNLLTVNRKADLFTIHLIQTKKFIN